jgi:murein DD-endopeptidase MepM/ murein hydrolase activator NlpD
MRFLATLASALLALIAQISALPPAPVMSLPQVVGATVTLMWSAPIGVGVRGYRLQAGTGAGLSNAADIVLGNATQFTAANVPAGIYYVRVSAIDIEGQGPPSNEVTVSVLGSGGGGCQPPAAPTDLTTLVNGPFVTLAWAPLSENDITYVVEAGSQQGASDVGRFGVSVSTLTASGPDGTYYVRVRGRNSCGVGPASQDKVVTLRTAVTTCAVAPNSRNRILPIFSSPFTPLPGYTAFFTQYFDHESAVGNSTMGSPLIFCGERVPGRLINHNGFDWSLPVGTPLFSVAEGRIVSAGPDPPFFCAASGRVVTNQLRIEVLHPVIQGEQFSSVYLHLSRVDVPVNLEVVRGQQIGLSGNSGCIGGGTGHVHFEVRRHTNTNSGRPTAVDPYGWQGTGIDPWSVHPQGAESLWLWRPGEAPWLR